MQDAFIVGKPAGTVKGYIVDHIVQNMDEVNELNAKAVEKGFAEYQAGIGVGRRVSRCRTLPRPHSSNERMGT